MKTKGVNLLQACHSLGAEYIHVIWADEPITGKVTVSLRCAYGNMPLRMDSKDFNKQFDKMESVGQASVIGFMKQSMDSIRRVTIAYFLGKYKK